MQGTADYALSNSTQFFDFSYCLTKDLDKNIALKVIRLEGCLEDELKSRGETLLEQHLKHVVAAELRHGATGSEGDNGSDVEFQDDEPLPAASAPNLCVSIQISADELPLCLPVQTSSQHASGDAKTWDQILEFPVKYRDLPPDTQLTIAVLKLCGTGTSAIVGGCTLPFFTRNNKLRQGSQRLKLWRGRLPDRSFPTTTPGKPTDPNEVDRLCKLVKKYDQRSIHRLPWLDRLAFEKIHKIKHEHDLYSDGLHLLIELPTFDFPLIFSEKESEDRSIMFSMHPRFCRIYDPEMYRENLVEAKHRRLMRGHHSGPLSRELKPDAKTRDQLESIIRYPPLRRLNDQEKDLLWKFRYYLSSTPKALTKFMSCVDWSDPWESKQALSLLNNWERVDVDDALALLGPGFAHPSIRAFAVQQLEKASDEDLNLYLLQLVQALRFDAAKPDGSSSRHGRLGHMSDTDNVAIGGGGSSSAADALGSGPVDLGNGGGTTTQESSSQSTAALQPETEPSRLAQFLIERSLKNECLGNYFHWYLMIECEDREVGKMYGKIAFQYMHAMMETPGGEERREMLRRQSELVAILSRLSHKIKVSKEPRMAKIEKLRAFLADPKNNLSSFPPLRLPLDPSVFVIGIRAEKASVFKSKMQPLFLHFICQDGSEYPIIFKTGDDMRQDQLAIQVITLMDRLLRKENLDLRLTPYRVLATGADQGMSQYIPSHPLASILAENNSSIISYFRKVNPSLDDPFGVAPSVIDTYLRSCAGYCVITYLLAVGDRHLDNLLLTPQGNLFHVDFGFILGRDPKPFPPPMKLCKEMVEAMGGVDAPFYQRFKSHCFVAFDILRRYANLILHLFQLMIESNVPDIAIEPDGAIQLVEERFKLGLSNEEAMQYFQGLILESTQALFPQVIETIHKWAQYWRN